MVRRHAVDMDRPPSPREQLAVYLAVLGIIAVAVLLTVLALTNLA